MKQDGMRHNDKKPRECNEPNGRPMMKRRQKDNRKISDEGKKLKKHKESPKPKHGKLNGNGTRKKLKDNGK